MLLPPEQTSQESVSSESFKDGNQFTKVLVVTPSGSLLDLAVILASGSVQVKVYTKYATILTTPDFTSSWRPWIRWADLIITDSPLILSKSEASRYEHKMLYRGEYRRYEGLDRILFLNEPAEPDKPWWQFWS